MFIQILNQILNIHDTTTFIYNYKSKPKQKIQPYNNGQVKVIDYQYDKVGNLTATTTKVQEESITSSYVYDGLGRVIKAVDPLGNISRTVYDENNNIIKTIDQRYYYLSDEEAPGIEYEYDALNRIVKTIGFDGTTKEVINYKEYDALGNVIKDVDGEGYNSDNPTQSIGDIYGYDVYGNKVTYVSAQTARDNMKMGTNYYTKKYTYNSTGKMLKVTDSLGYATNYSYYLNGRLKEIIYPDASKESFDYDLTGEIYTVKVDKAGNLTKEWNNIFGKPYLIEYADGTTKSYVYSPKGELLESYDQLNNPNYYGYDPSGNVVFSREYIKEDNSYKYYKLVRNNYDEANRLISTETFTNKLPKSRASEITETTGDKVEYVYDKSGKVSKIIGPNGRETINQYDRAGNVITRKQKVDDTNYDVKRYTYDYKNQLISESTLLKTTDIDMVYLSKAQFDNEYYDRVLSSINYSYYKNGKLKSKKDPQGNITYYEYNYDEKITKKTDPTLATTEYRYDLRGNLVNEINAKGKSIYYEYDSLNRLIREKKPSTDENFAITRYIYDPMGNLIKLIQPNNYELSKDTKELVNTMVGTSYQYDSMNRRIAKYSPDDEIIEYIKYDSKGQVEKIIDGLRYSENIETSKGMVYKYDGLGNLIQVTNSLDDSTCYEYDVSGNVIKQKDARNNITLFEYNPDKTLAKINYPDGGIISYGYDKLGRRTTQTDQRGNTTKFVYNGFGKEKIITDPYNYTIEYKYDLNANLVSKKDKRGNITLLKYDSNNRLLERKTPLELDGSKNIIYAVESYLYDSLGNVLKVTITESKDKLFKRETNYTYYDNSLVNTVTDNSGAYIKYYFDRNGNNILIEQLRDTNTYDIQKFEYDNQNRLVKQVELVDEEDIYNSGDFTNLDQLRDPEYSGKIQVITGFEYDVLGNRVKEILPRAYQYKETDVNNRANYTNTYTYDILKRPDRIIQKYNGQDIFEQFTYDEVGNLKTIRNARGYITVYTYDSLNRVKTITDPKLNSITYQYDLTDNQIAMTNAKNYTMTYTYDKLNRQETVKDPYNTIISNNIYDPNGNIVKQIDAKGYLSGTTNSERYGTIYQYDLANRVVKIIDPEIQGQNDPTKFTIKYKYNPIGQIIEQTDALYNTTDYEYDSAGRLIKVTDPLNVVITYSYDKMGNKVYMVDGRGKITKYTYGSFGLLKEATNADNKSIKFQYDLSENLALMTDRNGNHTKYTYDNRNLLLDQTVIETGDSISYTYDEVGNRHTLTDESGLSEYSYDQNNQLLEIYKDNILQINYTYDSIGNIETVTDKKDFTTTYMYDKSNRMETVSFNGNTTTYSYDKNGNRQSILYHNGVTEAYTYNKNNNLLTLTNKNIGGTTISSYSYTYDEIGRQKTKTDSFGTTTYTYDPADRVRQVEAPGKTTIYSYDNSGNRQTLNETYTSPQLSGYTDIISNKPVEYIIKKSEYVYSNTDQLLMLVEKMYDQTGKQVLQKTTNYLYDNNGNELRQKVSYILPHDMTMKQITTGNVYGENTTDDINNLLEKVNNTFDGFNRLQQVDRIKDGERVIVDYTYNGDGLRTKKIVKSSKEGYTAKETNYLYDRQHVILETNQSDNISVRYIRGSNYIGRIDSSDHLSYYLYNGHGDVVQTISEAGQIENQYDYDIFGTLILTVETYSNAIGYAGEFYDEETGLYYLRARYYNPYTGRFISADSYWGEDSNPLSLNLYTYTHNDPINFIDPTGHWEQGDETLSPEDQRKIKDLTDAYNSAETDEARQEIHEEAEAIRQQADQDNRRGDYNDSFADDVNNKIDENGYITAEEWIELSEEHNRRSGGVGNTHEAIQTILAEAEENFDYMMGTSDWEEEVANTNRYYSDRKEYLKIGYEQYKDENLLKSIFSPIDLYKDYLNQLSQGNLTIFTSAPEKLTLDLIMKDTDNNPNELSGIKEVFVDSLYDDNTDFGRFYTTINDLVSGLDPNKVVNELNPSEDFSKELHYFRNIINEDIAPKTLDELYEINAKLYEKYGSNEYGWELLPADKAAFHMNGPNGEWNVKLVLGINENFEAVYNKDENLVTEDSGEFGAINMGTYNFFGPSQQDLHKEFDVDPYYAWGNKNPSTAVGGGIVEYNIDYGTNLLIHKNNLDAVLNWWDVYIKTIGVVK